jgi:hypothetical protein
MNVDYIYLYGFVDGFFSRDTPMELLYPFNREKVSDQSLVVLIFSTYFE